MKKNIILVTLLLVSQVNLFAGGSLSFEEEQQIKQRMEQRRAMEKTDLQRLETLLKPIVAIRSKTKNPMTCSFYKWDNNGQVNFEEVASIANSAKKFSKKSKEDVSLLLEIAFFITSNNAFKTLANKL